MDLERFVREVPDFPQPGILFRDITPLLSDKDAFAAAVERLGAIAASFAPEAIVGIESRGFLFGAPLALQLGLPFVPVRKPGKLPAARVSVEYSLEYGSGQLEIHQDALRHGQHAFVVDDLLATGGTARATAQLIESIGALVCGIGFVIELSALGGRGVLEPHPVVSLLQYGG